MEPIESPLGISLLYVVKKATYAFDGSLVVDLGSGSISFEIPDGFYVEPNAKVRLILEITNNAKP